jgi:hypothetical protein
MINDPLCLFILYIIPSSIVRSDEVNGKVVARLVVSISGDEPYPNASGIGTEGCSIWRDADFDINRRAPAVIQAWNMFRLIPPEIMPER